MMRWLRGRKATGAPGAEEEIGKENGMPMASDNGDMESAVNEVKSLRKPSRNVPRRAAGGSKKSAPAKSLPAKTATPLRRSTRAKSRKSDGFFDAIQEATPDPIVADEAQMLQDLENPDESHVLLDEMEALQHVAAHTQSVEPAAEGDNREPAVEMTESLRDNVSPEEAVAAQEMAAAQETATSQAAEDGHSVYSATPALNHANQNSTTETMPSVDTPSISATGEYYIPASIRLDGSIRKEIRIRPTLGPLEPTNIEPKITFISTLPASEALPSQTDTATPSIPALSTSNQPNESFTSHRAIRPGGLSTSKYAVILAAAPTQASVFTTPFSAYGANINSGKRRHVEEEKGGPSGFQDERSAKRMRTKHSRESTGDRSTAIPQILPSTYDRYEWALINDNRRDSQDQSMYSEPEDTPERSVVGQDIIDRDPVIKTEPPDDAPSNPAVIPPAHQTLLTPAQSNSPSINQATTRPTATQLTEYIDLFRLCIPHSSVRQLTPAESSLLRDMERRAARILSGRQAKVDILSQLLAWMREGMSKSQRHQVATIQRRVKEAKSGHRRNTDVRSFNARAVASTPAPTRTAPVPLAPHHQQTSLMAAPAPPQVQPSAPQQARQPYGLDPLPYDKLFASSLVHSALEQVNNMLEAFGVNARCYLSGWDSITLKKNHEIVPPSLPPGCMPLTLENMPYTRLAGPALVNHALQRVNEMTSSLWPGQFVLHGNDMLQLHS
ncbi:hypothetical protein J4E91_000335 [Alternaria rosae]|nr:hypothetical protein J4E91_000335 [Alternaria rosae]